MPKFLDVTDRSAAKAALGFPETVTSVKTAAYTAAVGEFVRCDANAGGFTVTLPAAPVKGSVVVVRKIDTSSNTVLVQRGNGTDAFNVEGGPTGLQLATPGQSVTLRYDSGIWHVAGHSLTVYGLDQRYFVRTEGIVANSDLLRDSTGAPAITFSHTANAENHVLLQNAVVNGTVFVRSEGLDSNVDIGLRGKGTGSAGLYSRAFPSIVGIAPSTGTLVNYVDVSSSAGTNPVRFRSLGSAGTSINIDFVPWGSGAVTVNGTEVELTSRKGVANGYASLDADGRLPVSQLPVSAMEYKGVYNASTNTPSLTNGTGSSGDMYRVSVSGSRDFGAGSISLEAGDYLIYSGTEYQRVDAVDAVTSVAGKTGVVTLAAADLTDSTTTGRALITTTDASTARTTLGVAYGTTAGTVAQGNDSRITGAEQTSNKNAANGYAGLNASSQLTANTTGNAATATKLATARTISGVSFDGSANIVVNNGEWTPTDFNYIAWAYDPILMNTNGYVASGTLHLIGVRIPYATTITKVHLWVSIADANTVSNQCFAGLYQGGTLLASTASQHTAWQSVGLKSMDLTSSASVTAGLAYVALVYKTSGAEALRIGRTSTQSDNLFANGGLASNFRFASANTSITALPDPTYSTPSASGANTFWAGVS